MKKYLSIIVLLVISISVVACSNKANQVTSSKSLKSLTIGVMPDLDSLPLIIAAHNGYFKEEGIQVKIEHFKSASDRDTALQTGKIDGAISDMLSVVFFNDNNFDVKITSKTDGSFKIVAGKNSNITNVKQSSGKSIGISKNTIIEYLTDRIIESENLDINLVQKVSIPKIPTRLEMLTNGKLDMATLPEPLASTALLNGGKVLSSSDKIGINPGVMIFTKNSITSNPKEIKAFYSAYNKAIVYLKETKPESYIDYVIKEAGFPSTVKSNLTIPNYSLASMPTEKELKEVTNWLKTKKLSTNNYTLQDLSNNSFIK
ncbi:MetQ/NlpA family ABC transporter substrate-binding protein [Clostridium algoriphilum]|uniref:ABC transporter substrate-binding protein n=1 Tax=Clostridium algoriphilum TaxID=198347 RepID=UPI001CF1987A|nr:MetQ/NlpA family ABC transporter substrate-binding protein [Clostridium algoriphilum]MCB2292248.1 MetQ/NlpA family ABC transporter substrate-binding protein [Clostridium algoriphilum]